MTKYPGPPTKSCNPLHEDKSVFCSNEPSPFPISILKTKERYHTQPKVVKQQQNPLLVIKFKISSLVHPFSIVSHFNPVSIALLEHVSHFPDAMLIPTLLRVGRTQESWTSKRHCSSSKENRRTQLAGKRKRKLKTPFEFRRVMRQRTFWSP